MRKLFAFALIICLSSFILQQQPYKIGDKILDFSLPNALDNKPVRLYEFAQAKGVALVFTCNDCPYAKLYESRLLSIMGYYEDKGIKFLLINSNISTVNDADHVTKNAKKLREKGFPCPYLSDARQSIAGAFGAMRTPEVFVLKNVNGNLILHYKGAIDDNPHEERDVNNHYLKDALESIVNKSVVKMSETRATGCMIKRY